MIHKLDDCYICGNKPKVIIDLPKITIKCCKNIITGNISFESKLITEWNTLNKKCSQK